MSPTPLEPVQKAEASSLQSRGSQNGLARYNALTRNGGIVSRGSTTKRTFTSETALQKPLVFVSDSQNNVVDIYPQAGKNQKMIGQIPVPGTFGLATDNARNLYSVSVDSGGRGSVVVYAPPYTGAPILTLDDSSFIPVDVAVSPHGIVGVVNLCSAPSCANGSSSVSFYAKNTTKACATVADPTDFNYMQFGAFDDKGSLYVDGADPTTGNSVLGEIKGGCQARRITLLTMTSSLGNPASGIKVDKADRISILVSGSSPFINTYNPPKRGSLGSPVSTTPLTTVGLPTAFAFLASGRDLYTAEQGSNVPSELFDFPTGGAPENAITVTGSSGGVAVTPPLVP